MGDPPKAQFEGSFPRVRNAIRYRPNAPCPRYHVMSFGGMRRVCVVLATFGRYVLMG